ncbi:MAG: TonB-dependent receptor plug domain-containing protein [Steroidobacteraceae bacterium]
MKLNRLSGSALAFSLSLTIPPCAPAQTGGAAVVPPGTDREEVVISSERLTDPTHITTRAQKLIDVPGALGDPIAAAFSLPGVVYANGEFGEPAVRGSSPNDNLYMVDFLPAGYVFHAFLSSVFSENIIQDFQLHPAAFGPQYSDATGAVFDISLRAPKNQPWTSVVDVSMLRSGVFFEGGLTEHTAAYLSLRKSMIHLFVSKDKEKDGVRLEEAPQDDDYQFKYAWNVDEAQSLTFAANGASDLVAAQFGAASDVAQISPDYIGDARIHNSFRNRSVTWDYDSDSGSRLKVAVGQSQQDTTLAWGDSYFNNQFVKRSLAKFQYDQTLGSWHTLHLGGELSRNKLGIGYDQILFVCNEFDPTCQDTRRGRVTAAQEIRENSRALSLSDTWGVGENIDLELGAQYQSNTYTGERFVEPRGTLAFRPADHWTLSLKAGQYNRFPDLNTILPGLGNPELESPRATHFAAGLKQQLDRGWSWNAELYYKDLRDLPLALDPEQPDAARLYSNEVRGRAYGVDLLVDKQRTEKWYGWFSLSLAKSERTNERTGITRDYHLDTPLIANLVMNYRFTPRVDGGLRLTLRSGQATTPIIGIKENADFPGLVQPVYGEPFSARLPLYSRLDLRLKREFLVKGYQSAIVLDIINALNVRNLQGRALDYKRSRTSGMLYFKDTVGAGVFPALTFRITF